MPAESIKKFTLSGLRWLALKSVVGEVLGISAAIVLARLVSPAEFGHAAVALLFVLLAVILTFEGFAGALVQRPSVDESHRQVAVLLSVLGGTVLCAAVVAMAPLVWRPVFGAETTTLILIAAPAFVFASVGTVSRATLWRNLDFRKTTLIDLASTVSGDVTAVVLAALGLGAKAIVIGATGGIAVDALLLIASAPEPLPRWHRQEAREVGRYGLPAALAGLVSQLFTSVDYWILAARLSAYKTGIYYRAFNIGVNYQAKMSNVMMQLAFPVYARLEDRDEMRSLHERASRIHAAVICPLLTSFIAMAPIMVPYVFGSVWTPAVVPSQILAGAGMCAALLAGYPQVMMAVGRPRSLLQFNFVMLVTYVIAVSVAVDHGLIAVSIAVVAVYAIMLAGAYRFLLRPSIGLSLLSLLSEIRPAVAGCLTLVAVSWPLRVALEPQLPRALTICVVGSVGLGVYMLVLRFAFTDTWNDLGSLLVRALPPLTRLARSKGRLAAADTGIA